MSYVKPEDVHSPKNRWRLRKGSMTAGKAAEGAAIGNPQSRGLATWFIVPGELEGPVRAAIMNLPKGRRQD